jgi:hypothetical protein
MNNSNIVLERDIKAGNNMFRPFIRLLAEIPYYANGELYVVINKSNSLKDVQESRLNFLSTLDISVCTYEDKKQYKEIFLTIQQINLKLIENTFKKNLLIQEELFKVITNRGLNLNLCFYYGVIIKQSLFINLNFHNRLASHIKDKIFNNVKDFQKLIRIAIKFYNEEVDYIAGNIEKVKLSGWVQDSKILQHIYLRNDNNIYVFISF